MGRAKVLIADDHILVAEAFKTLLEPEYEVVGLVNNGRSLLTAAMDTSPDIVLLDLGMPLFNGTMRGRS